MPKTGMPERRKYLADGRSVFANQSPNADRAIRKGGTPVRSLRLSQSLRKSTKIRKEARSD
jgi:hypothetical protein